MDPRQIITSKHYTTSGRRFRCSVRTEAHIDATIARLALLNPAYRLQIIQGCYNTGVAASAGTHDFDAVLDYRIVGLSWPDTQRFLRECGWAAWYRTPAEGFSLEHVHAVSLGYDTKVGVFVPGQVDDYYVKALGLKGHHAPDSDRSWFPLDIPATVFDYAAWSDPMTELVKTCQRLGITPVKGARLLLRYATGRRGPVQNARILSARTTLSGME